MIQLQSKKRVRSITVIEILEVLLSFVFVCWTKAADLGNVDAFYLLSLLYRDGRGVKKNEQMEWLS